MTDEDNNSRRRNGSIRALLPAACIIALVLSAIGYAVYWAFFEREHSEWSEVALLWDGRSLEIHQNWSQRVYHGISQVPLFWGGGHPLKSVTFDAGGKAYRWEGKYIPIAVQFDQSGVYIVIYDRESIIDRNTGEHEIFRIYRASSLSKWDEITPTQFPKHLAIQNTWLHDYQAIMMDGKPEPSDAEIVAQMDPGNILFRESLTAKLWSYLEDPDFNLDADPSEDFLRQFKAK